MSVVDVAVGKVNGLNDETTAGWKESVAEDGALGCEATVATSVWFTSTPWKPTHARAVSLTPRQLLAFTRPSAFPNASVYVLFGRPAGPKPLPKMRRVDAVVTVGSVCGDRALMTGFA